VEGISSTLAPKKRRKHKNKTASYNTRRTKIFLRGYLKGSVVTGKKIIDIIFIPLTGRINKILLLFFTFLSPF
jgi:hypothetical protein